MRKEAIWISRYLLRQVYYWFKNSLKSIENWNVFWQNYIKYKSKEGEHDFFLAPHINDNTDETLIEPIYFYQDSWAFELIVNKQPQDHYDIGSHHKYVALLSKVVPVTMVDIRPLALSMSTINFKHGSITDLPYEDDSLLSISSLCVIEHIGLGRYGDPIDPMGSEKAINELKRVLQPGGFLYISVPVDQGSYVKFNAERVFKESYLFDLFNPLDIIQSKYIYNKSLNNNPTEGYQIGCYMLHKRSRG